MPFPSRRTVALPSSAKFERGDGCPDPPATTRAEKSGPGQRQGPSYVCRYAYPLLNTLWSIVGRTPCEYSPFTLDTGPRAAAYGVMSFWLCWAKSEGSKGPGSVAPV